MEREKRGAGETGYRRRDAGTPARRFIVQTFILLMLALSAFGQPDVFAPGGKGGGGTVFSTNLPPALQALVTNNAVNLTNLAHQVWTNSGGTIYPVQTSGPVVIGEIAPDAQFSSAALTIDDNVGNTPLVVGNSASSRPVLAVMAHGEFSTREPGGSIPQSLYTYLSGGATGYPITASLMQVDGTNGVLIDPFSDQGEEPFRFSTSTNNTIGNTAILHSIGNAGIRKAVYKGNGDLFWGANATVGWRPPATNGSAGQAIVTDGNTPQQLSYKTFLTDGAGGVTNVYTTNLYATNIFNTTFNGKTVITTNLYVSNAYFTNVYVSANLSLSNLPANSILGTDAGQNVTNINVGSGLTFSDNTLSATQPASGGQLASVPASAAGPRKHFEMQAIGESGSTATGYSLWGWNLSSVNSSTSVAATSTKPGYLLNYVSAAVNPFALQDVNTGGASAMGSYNKSLWFRFRIQATNIVNMRYQIGLSDTYSTQIGQTQVITNNVIMFTFSTNSANWFFTTGDGAAQQTTDTTLAATVNDVDLMFVYNVGVNAIAYTNGVVCCTNTTHLPTGTWTPMLRGCPTTSTTAGLKTYGFYGEQDW